MPPDSWLPAEVTARADKSAARLDDIIENSDRRLAAYNAKTPTAASKGATHGYPESVVAGKTEREVLLGSDKEAADWEKRAAKEKKLGKVRQKNPEFGKLTDQKTLVSEAEKDLAKAEEKMHKLVNGLDKKGKDKWWKKFGKYIGKGGKWIGPLSVLASAAGGVSAYGKAKGREGWGNQDLKGKALMINEVLEDDWLPTFLGDPGTSRFRDYYDNLTSGPGLRPYAELQEAKKLRPPSGGGSSGNFGNDLPPYDRLGINLIAPQGPVYGGGFGGGGFSGGGGASGSLRGIRNAR